MNNDKENDRIAKKKVNYTVIIRCVCACMWILYRVRIRGHFFFDRYFKGASTTILCILYIIYDVGHRNGPEIRTVIKKKKRYVQCSETRNEDPLSNDNEYRSGAIYEEDNI